MELTSVNIGTQRTQPKGNELETTGIYKLPAREPVQITTLGIREDFIGDLANHGGVDQAVFMYGMPDYEWWAGELHQPLLPGTFGENLTIDGLRSAQFNIGDRFHVGSVILEVTAPRTPCSTLARRMGDPMFVKRYRRAELPGLYCRVIREGSVQAGDSVSVEPYRADAVAALELFRDHYRLDKDETVLRRLLRAPISVRARADITAHLQKLIGGK